MKKLTLLLTILALILPVQLSDTNAQSATVPLYGLFEAAFAVRGNYTNPYNPDEINVTVTLTSPTGQTVTVPAFYTQPYRDTCRGTCPFEQLEADGTGEWRFRFTPTELGEWRYRVSAQGGGEAVNVTSGRFEAVESDAAGFVRIAPNQRYFEFDNQTPYFPVGQNLGWSWEAGGGIYTYLEWLTNLADAGANYARIFIDVPWFIGLEWTSPAGQYAVGQQAAWRFDQILEAAAEKGIYLQVVLIWDQAFREYTGVPVNVPVNPPRPDIGADFDNHPYNVRQGGSLQGPGEIFLNSIAQDWLANRLRYIAARWAYSPQIFAWEIVSNLDRIAGFTPDRDIDWLVGVIEAFQSNDPNDHLMTVSTRNVYPTLQSNPLIDFSQTQVYQARPIEQAADQATSVFASISQYRALVEHPILLNEFSLNPWFEPTADDPTGIHVQNSIWAAVFSGAAGGAMSWWWDTYIAPQNLYPLYTSLAFFADGIPWNTSIFVPTEVGFVSSTSIEYEPLRITNFNRQFRSASPDGLVYHLTADGAAPPTTQMSSYLYGQQFNTTNRRAETFIVTPPVDTTFIVGIRNVSTAADAQLTISVDGEVVFISDLSANTGETTFRLPIKAGHHKVVLENTGADWLQLEYLEISAYRSPLRSLALVDSDSGIALVWLHHRDYTWQQKQTGTTITPLNGRLDLPNMPIGVYRVEFWDTATGNVVGEDHVQVQEEDNGVLHISLLPITSQLALRVFRIN